MNVGKRNEVDIFFEKGKNFGKTNSGNYYDVKKIQHDKTQHIF